MHSRRTYVHTLTHPPAHSRTQDTDELVMADTNPKTWMRFWRCSVESMYDACRCLDPQSSRAGGLIRIARKGTACASKLAEKYMVWWV